jgi:hypothetical protein
MFEVGIEAHPRTLQALGQPSDHATTYTKTSTAVDIGTDLEKEPLGKTGIAKFNFPTKLSDGADEATFPGKNILNPALNLSITRSNPGVDTRGSGGTTVHEVTDKGKQSWSQGQFDVTVHVRTWHETSVGHTGPASATPTRVRVPALAQMPHAAAHRLGLAGRPDPPAGPHAAPGTLRPPANVLRGDGLGYATVGEVPDLALLHNNIVGVAQSKLSSVEAAAVRAELSKVTTRTGSRAMLEPSLDTHSLLIPVRDKGVLTSYVKVNITSVLRNPHHVGPDPAPMSTKHGGANSVTDQKVDVGVANGNVGVGLTKTYDSNARSAYRELGVGATGTHQRQTLTLAADKTQASDGGTVEYDSGAGGGPPNAKFTFDVTYQASIDRARAPIALLNTPTMDWLHYTDHFPVPDSVTSHSLELSFPERLTQPHTLGTSAPPARATGPVTRQRFPAGAQDPGVGRGAILTPQDLRGAQVESIGGKADLRANALDVIPRNEGSASWQRGPHRQDQLIQTATSDAYLKNWLPKMLTGQGEPLAVTVPGALHDGAGTLTMTPRIISWHSTDIDVNGVTLGGTKTVTSGNTTADHTAWTWDSSNPSLSGTVAISDSTNIGHVDDPKFANTVQHNLGLNLAKNRTTEEFQAADSAPHPTETGASGVDQTRISVDHVEWTLLWRPDHGEVRISTFDV